MKSIKQLILTTALLGITGSVSHVYAMERDEPAGAEEDKKESMEQHEEARITQANKDLLTGAKTNNFELVKYALDNGANPNTLNPAHQTALFLAQAPAIIDLLIAHNANVNAKDSQNFTPLHVAENAAKVHALHNAGALIDVRASRFQRGMTPLHAACISITNYEEFPKGQKAVAAVEVIDALLTAGANPEIKTEDTARFPNQWTALQNFVNRVDKRYYGSYDLDVVKSIIEKLVGAGAQPFDMSTIISERLKRMVNGAFAEKEKRWMQRWPRGQGPAILRENLPQDLRRDVSGIMDEYLTLPEEQEDAGAAATQK